MAATPGRSEQPTKRAPWPRDPESIADRIQDENPHWLVVWGEFSKYYTAFPLFNGGTYVTAPDPDTLVARMGVTERDAARSRKPQRGRP